VNAVFLVHLAFRVEILHERLTEKPDKDLLRFKPIFKDGLIAQDEGQWSGDDIKA
jgi:hypothetical protein